MEPLDTDLEYVSNEPRPATTASRLNALLIFPILGVLIIITFISAAIFQLNLSQDLIDTLVGLMLVFFIAFIIMLFWAFAPRANQG